MTVDPIRSIREHLLRSGLNFKPDALEVIVDNGNILSMPSLDNVHFTINYEIKIIIRETQHRFSSLAFVVLEWLDHHQPHRGEDALSFNIDHINHNEADVEFSLKLNETIMVTRDEDGANLTSVQFPRFDETCPKTTIQITTQYHPR